MSTVGFDDFLAIDIRVGVVQKAQRLEGARRPTIQVWIDFGAEIGIKKSSAQITDHYTPETLVGRQVLAVVNFPPKQIGHFMSEVLVLGVNDSEGHVVLVEPALPVPPGQRLH